MMHERQAKELSECTFAPKVKKKTTTRPKAKHLGESLTLMPERINTMPASEQKGDQAPQQSLINKLSAGESYGGDPAMYSTGGRHPERVTRRLSGQRSAANLRHVGLRSNNSSSNLQTPDQRSQEEDGAGLRQT